jgi:hypothetical protein
VIGTAAFGQEQTFIISSNCERIGGGTVIEFAHVFPHGPNKKGLSGSLSPSDFVRWWQIRTADQRLIAGGLYSLASCLLARPHSPKRAEARRKVTFSSRY